MVEIETNQINGYYLTEISFSFLFDIIYKIQIEGSFWFG